MRWDGSGASWLLSTPLHPSLPSLPHRPGALLWSPGCSAFTFNDLCKVKALVMILWAGHGAGAVLPTLRKQNDHELEASLGYRGRLRLKIN